MITQNDNTTQQSHPLRFCSFGSGSSGNCTYVGTSRGGIIIDAGLKVRTVMPMLQASGIDPAMVAGVMLTHDHIDHTRSVYGLVSRHKQYGWRVFCTQKMFDRLVTRSYVSEKITDYFKPISKIDPFELAGFTITPIETSHDSADSMGFMLETEGHSFALVTDTGYVSDQAKVCMRRAHTIMIESDYDTDMLWNGPYDHDLKVRIDGDKGHLCNEAAAQAVTQNHSPQLRHVLLCHLSEENNTPQKARDTMRHALDGCGATQVKVTVLPRHEATPIIEL